MESSWGGRLSSRLLTLTLGLAAIGAGLEEVAQGADLETDVSFRLESWLTYDDNVYLSTRRSEEIDLEDPERHPPGESDTFAHLLGDVRLEGTWMEQEEPLLQGFLDYEYARRFYADEDTENFYRQRLESGLQLRPQEPFSLRLSAGSEWDNRRRSASYGLLDYWEYWLGAEALYQPDADNRFELAYEYGERDYDRPEPGETAAYHDFRWHRLSGSYRRSLSKTWTAEGLLSYRWRDYDQDARDAAGRLLPDRSREDRYGEAGARLTGMLTETTAFRLGYLYGNNDSTGPYYRFDRHRLYGLLFQQLAEQTNAYLYVQRQWKSYEDQIAYSDPFGARTPQGSRSDREWLILVGAEQGLGEHLDLYIEYNYVNNRSNDATSRYEGNQYSVGMRWEF